MRCKGLSIRDRAPTKAARLRKRSAAPEKKHKRGSAVSSRGINSRGPMRKNSVLRQVSARSEPRYCLRGLAF